MSRHGFSLQSSGEIPCRENSEIKSGGERSPSHPAPPPARTPRLHTVTPYERRLMMRARCQNPRFAPPPGSTAAAAGPLKRVVTRAVSGGPSAPCVRFHAQEGRVEIGENRRPVSLLESSPLPPESLSNDAVYDACSPLTPPQTLTLPPPSLRIVLVAQEPGRELEHELNEFSGAAASSPGPDHAGTQSPGERRVATAPTTPLWSGTNKNRDVSTGPLAHPFARSLALLTRSLPRDCSLCSRPPLRSLRSLPRSWDSE